MSKGFDIEVGCFVVLTVDDIWPDHDAPVEPTVDDVITVIKKSGGLSTFLRDWGLGADLEICVNGKAVVW